MISIRLRLRYRRLPYLTGMTLHTLCLEGVPAPVCFITAIRAHPLRLGQIVQQCCSAGIMANQADGHEEAELAIINTRRSSTLGLRGNWGNLA
jgi:hypothetical protein